MSESGAERSHSLIDRTRYAALRHQLSTEDVSSHLALFYRSRDEKRTAATAFIDIGLRNNEQCLYIYDESNLASLNAQFREAGVDVEYREEVGDLQFVDGREYYLSDGFDPERMTEDLEAAAAEATAEGYDGLRVAGENTWSFELEETFESIIEFEASFDRDCSSIPSRTLCQYNLERFDETAIVKALRTHKHLVYRDTVCENPHYVPPQDYADATDASSNATAILEQTYELSESRQAVDAQRQRLEVINRIFRHNIRNDMNVLLAYLDVFEENDLIAPEGREDLQTMRETLLRFIDTTEQARYIEQTVQDSQVVPVGLTGVVEENAAALDSEFPEANISLAGLDAVMVVADEHIGVAVEELLRNAIVHAESDPAAVEVRITTCETPGSARLTVRNEGSVPASTRRVIEQGTETQLQHTSGLGLWLVKWLVEKSYGKLTLSDNGDSCQVQVDLPTVIPDRQHR